MHKLRGSRAVGLSGRTSSKSVDLQGSSSRGSEGAQRARTKRAALTADIAQLRVKKRKRIFFFFYPPTTPCGGRAGTHARLGGGVSAAGSSNSGLTV